MEFERMSIVGDVYTINKGKRFMGVELNLDYIQPVFDFSYNMTFGKLGVHRNYRSGGQFSRKNGELFANTFQGKLSEFVVYDLITKIGLTIERPSLETWELGKWDDVDFQVNELKISVKSASFFSNLLLLESKDWDDKGTYIPNDVVYDIHILVRIKPDLKGLLRSNRLLFSEYVDKESLLRIIQLEKFYWDVPGYLTNRDVSTLIQSKYVIPQNAMLNGKTRMDAENFYCQTGSLRNIDNLILCFV
jgi:hypothetical protein